MKSCPLQWAIASFIIVCMMSVVQAETIKIGVLTPLSVPGDANAGALIVRGARLGAEYVNTVRGGIRNGTRIELRIENDGGIPEKGVAGYRKLVQQGQAVAVLGQYHSSVMLAVQKVAEKLGTPIFSTQAANQKITLKHFATTFRTHVIDPDRITLWLGFIKEMGYERVAILAESSAYGYGLIKGTKKRNKAEKLGLKLKTMTIDRSAALLTEQLEDVRVWRPDLVVNATSPPVALAMTQQAFEIGLFPRVPMLASYDWPIRAEYWDALGEKGNWMLYIAYYHPIMKKTELGDWFAEKYRQRYKEPPLYTAFNAFGDVVIISAALDKATSTQPQDVIAALETDSYQSWNGEVKFERGEDHWHQWSPPIMILQHTQLNQDWETADIIYPLDMKTGTYKTP